MPSVRHILGRRVRRGRAKPAGSQDDNKLRRQRGETERQERNRANGGKRRLLLALLLRVDVGDLEGCEGGRQSVISHVHTESHVAVRLTRRERLAELLGLVGVSQAEGVQVARAADLELVLGLRDTRSANLAVSRLLDGRGWIRG